jgi:hypothetical protein
MVHNLEKMADNGDICAECGKQFLTKKDFSWHILSVHKQEPVKCDVCEEEFTSKRQLWNHKKKHRTSEIKCEECGKSLKLGSITAHKKKHIKNDVQEEEVNHSCNKCKYSTTIKCNMKRHIQFSCEQKEQKAKPLHMCNVCYQMFHMKKHLNRHKETHVSREEQDISCTVCYKKQSRRDNLKRHMKDKHGITEKGNIVENSAGFVKFETSYLKKAAVEVPMQDSVNEFKCNQCEYKTVRNRNMERHIKKVHELNGKTGRKSKCDDDISRATKYRRKAEEPRKRKL